MLGSWKNWIGDGSCLWGCVWRGVGSGGSEKLFSGEIRSKFDPLFFHILHYFFAKDLINHSLEASTSYRALIGQIGSVDWLISLKVNILAFPIKVHQHTKEQRCVFQDPFRNNVLQCC